MMKFKDVSHRRYNPLTQEWVVVSPHRTQRPWQGQMEDVARPGDVRYDPACYLCPGNVRANGEANPDYAEIFVFDNDYAALQKDAGQEEFALNALMKARAETGICRVVCFSPRHDLTLARMSVEDVVKVVEAWEDQSRELGSRPEINAVMIFENRGAMMGASNPHPHGQIWACNSLPNEILKEQTGQNAYRAAERSCLLCDYAALEGKEKERVVFEDERMLVVVPFWAVWPFETLLFPKGHVRSFLDLDAIGRRSLAEALKATTTAYDNVFKAPFPYSMGFHQAPSDGEEHDEWHLHAHFYPPLLRSATVRKFMVGFELLGTPQRDIVPEAAAERLRAVSGAQRPER